MKTTLVMACMFVYFTVGCLDTTKSSVDITHDPWPCCAKNECPEEEHSYLGCVYTEGPLDGTCICTRDISDPTDIECCVDGC